MQFEQTVGTHSFHIFLFKFFSPASSFIYLFSVILVEMKYNI